MTTMMQVRQLLTHTNPRVAVLSMCWLG